MKEKLFISLSRLGNWNEFFPSKKPKINSSHPLMLKTTADFDYLIVNTAAEAVSIEKQQRYPI